MLTAKTTELQLMQGWFDSDPEHARVRVAFPINKWAGSRDSAVVYFEVKAGDRLARHTDSAEEILYIVAGEAEAEVGDQRGRLAAGDLAAMHVLRPAVTGALLDTPQPVVLAFTSYRARAVDPRGSSAVATRRSIDLREDQPD